MSKAMYSTDDAAKLLGTTNGYLRLLVRQYPDIAPKMIDHIYVWTFEDIERVRNWQKRQEEDLTK